MKMDCISYLREVSRKNDDFTRMVLAQGILWAEESCRISGTMSRVLYSADEEGARRLLDHFVAAGLTVMAEVPRYINENNEVCWKLLCPSDFGF